MTPRQPRPVLPLHQLFNKAIDEAPPSDVEFHNAVMNASMAFRGAALRKGATHGVTIKLLEGLLCGQSLRRDERACLARLISGDQKPRTGRPPRNPDELDNIARVMAEARRPRPGVDGEAAVSELVKWLRSDRPLGRGELLSVAQLIAGELNTTGRRTKCSSENSSERALIYQALSRELHLKIIWTPKRKQPELDDPEAAKWAAALTPEYNKRRNVIRTADDALQKAAEWAAKDPRAQGASVETLRKKMLASRRAWKEECRRKRRLP